MNPTFALEIAPDTLTLSHRRFGAWHSLGTVRRDDPRCPQRMDELRRTADWLEPNSIRTAVVVAASQVMFLTVALPSNSRGNKRREIREALKTATPFPVEDIEFDFVSEDGGARVAIVAKTALAEAEAIAVHFKLNPVRFAAHPSVRDFNGEPDFGPTEYAAHVKELQLMPTKRKKPPSGGGNRRSAPPPPREKAPREAPRAESTSSPAATERPAPKATPAAPVAEAPRANTPVSGPLASIATPSLTFASRRGPSVELRATKGGSPGATPVTPGAPVFSSMARKSSVRAEPKVAAPKTKPQPTLRPASAAAAKPAARPTPAATSKPQAPAQHVLDDLPPMSQLEGRARGDATRPARDPRVAPSAQQPDPRQRDAREARDPREARAQHPARETGTGRAQPASAPRQAAPQRAPDQRPQQPIQQGGDTPRFGQGRPADGRGQQQRPPQNPQGAESGRQRQQQADNAGQFRRAPQDDPRQENPHRGDPRQGDPHQADPRQADPREANRRQADPRQGEQFAPDQPDPRQARGPAYPDQDGPYGSEVAHRDQPQPGARGQRGQPQPDERQPAGATLTPDSDPQAKKGRGILGTRLARRQMSESEQMSIFGSRDEEERRRVPVMPLAAAIGALLLVAGGVWGAYYMLVSSDDIAGTGDQPPSVELALADAVAGLPERGGQAPEPRPDSITGIAAVDTGDGGTQIASVDPVDVDSDGSAARAAIEAATAAALAGPNPPPGRPAEQATGQSDDIVIAAVDHRIPAEDAVAPPLARLLVEDEAPVPLATPAPFGTDYEFDDNGFVIATKDGALTPDGVVVFAGPPIKTPQKNPQIAAAIASGAVLAAVAVQTALEDDPQPRARPASLVQPADAPSDASVATDAEGTQTAAVDATTTNASDLEAAVSETLDQVASTDATSAPEAQFSSTSLIPQARPASLVQRVAQARATVAASQPTAPAQPTQQTTAAVATAPAASAPAPAIPTRASVARTATESDAITLSRLNLIGVYGSPSDRRALLRLPSGRYVKVKVGDRIDGGQVAQIGQGDLQYVKDGRTVTLAMPRG